MLNPRVSFIFLVSLQQAREKYCTVLITAVDDAWMTSENTIISNISQQHDDDGVVDVRRQQDNTPYENKTNYFFMRLAVGLCVSSPINCLFWALIGKKDK